MPNKKIISFLWKLLAAALIAAGVLVFFRWLLAWVLPFLIAMLAAKLMEPVIRKLTERCKIPRWLAAALLTLVVVGAILTLAFWGLSRLVYEARGWLGQLPALLSNMPDWAAAFRGQLESLIAAAPEEMREFLRGSLESLLEGGVGIPGEIYTLLMGWITSLASALPAVMLFSIALVLSTYFISSDYPRVVRAILSQIPARWQEKAMEMLRHTMNTMGKWLRAQGILALTTFMTAAAGLLILRVEYAVVIALVVAFVDALPVLGPGLALLPWSLYCLIAGETARGLGLVILYAVISLVRGFWEPKLVGRQIGLHPLMTLMAMYIGFKAVGIAGMILFPLLAIVWKQLSAWGYLKMWK